MSLMGLDYHRAFRRLHVLTKKLESVVNRN